MVHNSKFRVWLLTIAGLLLLVTVGFVLRMNYGADTTGKINSNTKQNDKRTSNKVKVVHEKTKLVPQMILQLPDRWSAYVGSSMMTNSGRVNELLYFGPYSFAVSKDDGVFLTDDKSKSIILVDWKGKVKAEYRDPEKQYKGSFSDITFSKGLLYAGCTDKAAILVFDVKTGELVRRIVLADDAMQTQRYTEGRSTKDPIISRFGVDEQGIIHTGMRYGSFDGNQSWVYPVDKDEVLADGNTRTGRGELWSVGPDGKSILFNGLKDFIGKTKGSASEVIGVNNEGLLFAYVWSFDESAVPKPNYKGPFLVSLNQNGNIESIFGYINLLENPRRESGHRHSIIAEDGNLYMLKLKAYPKKAGETVKLQLHRLALE